MRHLFRRLLTAGISLGFLALVGCGEGEAECPEQNAICGGVCTPILSDTNNCGGCGNSCSSGFECVEGACVRPDCAAGTELCENACTDFQTDRDHCGACGQACGTGESCEEGVCVEIVCEEDTVLCENDCVDLDTDRKNCGSCGTTCGANEACEAGSCVEIPCEGEDCDEAATALYASCFQGGTITRFDTQTLTAHTKKASGVDGPQSMAVLGEDHIVVAGGFDQMLYVYDRHTMDLAGKTTIGASPEQVIVRGQKAFVINSLINTIQVVDLANPSGPRTVDEVTTGTKTNPMLGDFDSRQTLWVSLYETGELLPLDFSGATGAKGQPVALPKPEGAAKPTGVAIIGDVAYVTLNNLGEDWEPAGNGRVATVDLLTRATGSIDLGASCLNPGSIKAVGSLLAVTCTGSYSDPELAGEVVIVDPAAGSVTRRFDTGGSPVNVAVDKVAGKLYVGDSASVEFLVIDMASAGVERVAVCNPVDWEFVSDLVLGY